MTSIVFHPVWVMSWFLVASILMVVGIGFASRPKVHNTCLIATMFAVSVAATSMITHSEGQQLVNMFHRSGDVQMAADMQSAIHNGDVMAIWELSIRCGALVQAAHPSLCSSNTNTPLTADL